MTETPNPPKRPMTLSEAGRKGGEKVKKERGLDFYAEIGRKGGRRVAQNHGPSFYAEIGRKGGEARRREAGAEPTPEENLGGQNPPGPRGGPQKPGP